MLELLSAIGGIVLVDLALSGDNALVIGALASGHLPVLAFGLLVSVGLVLAGSALVARLIQRLYWLLDVAALVLGWTGAGMLLHDLRLGTVLRDTLPHIEALVYTLGVGVVLIVDVLLRAQDARRRA